MHRELTTETGLLTSIEAKWAKEGFSIWPMKGSFVAGFATIWFKKTSDMPVFRTVVTRQHLNGFGAVHGGFLSTLADIWLGYSVAMRLPESARFVTSSLTMDFLRPAGEGCWLQSHVDRIRIGRRLCHASGAILIGSIPVAAARATFAVL